jgi:hypothetical protein
MMQDFKPFCMTGDGALKSDPIRPANMLKIVFRYFSVPPLIRNTISILWTDSGWLFAVTEVLPFQKFWRADHEKIRLHIRTASGRPGTFHTAKG